MIEHGRKHARILLGNNSNTRIRSIVADLWPCPLSFHPALPPPLWHLHPFGLCTSLPPHWSRLIVFGLVSLTDDEQSSVRVLVSAGSPRFLFTYECQHLFGNSSSIYRFLSTVMISVCSSVKKKVTLRKLDFTQSLSWTSLVLTELNCFVFTFLLILFF